jgi:hypothetical protein
VHHVLHLISAWIDEDHSGPANLLAGRSIEVEHPVGLDEDWFPGLHGCGVRIRARTLGDACGGRPLYDEVSQDVTLDGMAWSKIQPELSKFRSPLSDVACGVRVVEDGPSWEGGHHHNPVRLEIMAQLPRRDKHNIEDFVRLKVPGFRLMKNLTDVVDWPLDGSDPC